MRFTYVVKSNKINIYTIYRKIINIDTKEKLAKNDFIKIRYILNIILNI